MGCVVSFGNFVLGSVVNFGDYHLLGLVPQLVPHQSGFLGWTPSRLVAGLPCCCLLVVFGDVVLLNPVKEVVRGDHFPCPRDGGS